MPLRAARSAARLGPPFQLGRRRSGRLDLHDEPELHLGSHVVVPDLAAWRRERLPALPDTAWIEVAPDWVCEVLSPSTERYDRGEKRAIYADAGVRHVWHIDPVAAHARGVRADVMGSGCCSPRSATTQKSLRRHSPRLPSPSVCCGRSNPRPRRTSNAGSRLSTSSSPAPATAARSAGRLPRRKPAAELQVRACQCGFCTRHGAMTVSDPGGTRHLRDRAGGADALPVRHAHRHQPDLRALRHVRRRRSWRTAARCGRS